MKRSSLWLMTTIFCLSLVCTTGAKSQALRDVLTYHNDFHRSGVYSTETTLRPAVISAGFGKIYARRVWGQIWGQPLYVHNVPVKGKLRNVVYVATSENMVYAFDADDRTPDEQTPPLIKVHLGDPVPITINPDDNFHTILPSNGISSTPVIERGTPLDPQSGTLYVVADLVKDGGFHIFALDLGTLSIRLDVAVAATGGPSNSIRFDAPSHLNRPALLVSKNSLIVAFGNGPSNIGEHPNYHGWVMAYSLPDLVQTGTFVTAPNAGMASIWQAGGGPAADAAGNIYFMTGNGHFQLNGAGQPDLADSFVKLANDNGKLSLVDWYAPRSRDALESCDLDLGSSGPGVIEDSAKVVGAGKSGILYSLDKETMGDKDNKGRTERAYDERARAQWIGEPDCTIGQCFRIAQNQFPPMASHAQQGCDTSGFPYGDSGFNDSNWQTVVDSYPHVHGTPVLWKMHDKSFNLYVWPEEDYLKAYHFDGQEFQTTPVGSSAPVGAAVMSMPGGLLSLSWDGHDINTAVIWAARPNPHPGYVVGGPAVSVFHDQQHFVGRDKYGDIWDSFYVRGDGWHFQQIDTNGHPAAGDAAVSVFSAADQQHFAYFDSAARVWDSFYVRSDNSWHFQSINTGGHTPVGGLAVSDFHDQEHFVFRDAAGRIWDSFYVQSADQWKFQQINTQGHLAASDIVVSVFSAADQQHFAFLDGAGRIWDSFYARGDDSWHFQPIDGHGHSPVGGLAVSDFYDQQHFVYRDAGGRIWDSFYVRSADQWKFQEINTQGHPAASNVFVSVFPAAEQQHFAYVDGSGNIEDSFYVKPNDSWHHQQLASHAHTPLGGIVVSAFYDQQHFVFRDGAGVLWDSFYAQTGDQWSFQQVNGCMYGTEHAADLAPNSAPCNAIDKIVPGYLQAFAATPGPDGQLKELWNSENNPNDRVEWFSKESPPTIADNKVFLAEFPAKPSTDNWNAKNALGRLIVYSSRGRRVSRPRAEEAVRPP
jgi:hypothetical protein